jgi:general secretion pathway protein C
MTTLKTLTRSGPHQRLPNLLSGMLTVVLVVVVAYQAATVTWRLVTMGQGTGEQTRLSPGGALLPATKGQGPEPYAMDLSALTDQHLFGQAVTSGNAPPPAAATPQTPAATSLSLRLAGLFCSSVPDQSVAIIAEQGKKGSEAIYGPGEELPGKAMLSEILPDHVILLRAGRQETLFLEAAAGATPLDALAAASPAAAAKAASKAGPVTMTGTPVQVDRRLWEQHLADLPALANEVGVEVYPPGGAKQEGYRLLAKEDSKVMADLALQAGDVIVAINGQALTNPSSAIQAYNTMKEAEAISVQILRDGQRQTKNYTIGHN